MKPKANKPYSPWAQMVNRYTWLVSHHFAGHKTFFPKAAEDGMFDGMTRAELKEAIADIIKEDVECTFFVMSRKGSDITREFLAAATPGILEEIDFYALADLYLENTYAISSLNTQTIKDES